MVVGIIISLDSAAMRLRGLGKGIIRAVGDMDGIGIGIRGVEGEVGVGDIEVVSRCLFLLVVA